MNKLSRYSRFCRESVSFCIFRHSHFCLVFVAVYLVFTYQKCLKSVSKVSHFANPSHSRFFVSNKGMIYRIPLVDIKMEAWKEIWRIGKGELCLHHDFDEC